MIEIQYASSDGKEYNLVGDRMRATSGYFHEYEWKPMTTDQEIGADVYGFEKEAKTYQITLTFRGPIEERKAKMDELTNSFEYDIVNKTPGRIWFGRYYIDCYIKDAASKVSATKNNWTDMEIGIYWIIHMVIRMIIPDHPPGRSTGMWTTTGAATSA